VLHMQSYKQRALKGESDRQLDFGKGGSIWVVRSQTRHQHMEP
jgi:hypothetical protein